MSKIKIIISIKYNLKNKRSILYYIITYVPFI